MTNLNSSEQKILACMLDERAHSPRDLSITCGMNEPAVRYHLRNLVKLGLIRKTPSSGKSLKPGRKPDFYRRSSTDDSHALLRLTRSLLDLVGATSGDSDPAEKLALQFVFPLDDSISELKLSVPEATQWLCRYHYAASWIAGKSGPEIMAANCPYCDLQPGLDILCRMDTAILRRLTGLSWKKECQGDPASVGGICRFVLAE